MTKAYELLIFAGIWALLHGVTDIITGFQIKTTWAPARRCHGSALRSTWQTGSHRREKGGVIQAERKDRAVEQQD
jgi:hypothetical protein